VLRLLTLASLVVAAPLPQAADPVAAILDALRLPALVTEARQAGVSEASVREVLDGLRRRGLPADEAAIVLREEVDAVNAGGPKDNFGGFVQRQLAAGLRGRALAEAIRAEHRARGIGHLEGRQPQGRDTTRPKGKKP
jgi:hypothetical protein